MRSVSSPACALAVVTLLASCAAGGPARDLSARVPSACLHSLKDLRDRNVVKQDFDYSCGAASLATLLRFYFRDPVSERALLLDMLKSLSAAETQDRIANGFTLLDLQGAAQRRGYQAEGVALEMKSLTELGGPVLLHMNIQGQRHFLVFRGVSGDRIFLADPNRGNVRMDVWRFARQWTGVALALGREGVEIPATHPLSLRSEEKSYPEWETARRSLYTP